VVVENHLGIQAAEEDEQPQEESESDQSSVVNQEEVALRRSSR
jgi:hypothetical protein